jgi:acyl-CoA thioesterase YciA
MTIQRTGDNLAIRIVAMPRDTNPNGDMFGGWLISLMDMAASLEASKTSGGRVVTVAMDAIAFHKPVAVGDEVSCYTELLNVGRSSMKIAIEVWIRKRHSEETMKVTEGQFTFVAIDENGRPTPVERGEIGLGI